MGNVRKPQSGRELTNLVEDLLQEAGIRTPPVDLLRVAEVLDVPVLRCADLGGPIGLLIQVPDYDGFLLRGIILQIQEYRPREQFTFAHEIGHLVAGHHRSVIHRETNATVSWGVNKTFDRWEQEANRFAAELLMPDFLIRPSVNSLPIEIESLHALKDKFDISLEAAGRQFVKVNSSRCAFLLFDIDSNYCYSDCSDLWLETFGSDIGSLSGYKREFLCNLRTGKISRTTIPGPFVELSSDYTLDCRYFVYRKVRRILALIRA